MEVIRSKSLFSTLKIAASQQRATVPWVSCVPTIIAPVGFVGPDPHRTAWVTLAPDPTQETHETLRPITMVVAAVVVALLVIHVLVVVVVAVVVVVVEVEVVEVEVEEVAVLVL